MTEAVIIWKPEYIYIYIYIYIYNFYLNTCVINNDIAVQRDKTLF